MKKIFIFIGICFIFLSACSTKKYPEVTSPHDLAITVNIKDNSITFIDIENIKKIEEWDMADPYNGGLMLPDGDSLLLFGKQLETVDVYSLKQGKKIESWDVGKGIVTGILLQNKKEIAFADQFQHAIRLFSLDGREMGMVKTNKNPLTLLENEKGNLYTISYSSQNLSIIDVQEMKEVNRFTIHPSAAGALLKEGKDEIWIGGHGEGVEIETDIHIYHSSTGELLRKVSAPLMPVNFSQKDPFIFSLSHGSNTLYKFSEDGKVLDSLKVGANPFEMKVLKDSLIIAGYDSDDVHLIDTHTMTIENTIPVGKGPFQLILRERVNGE